MQGDHDIDPLKLLINGVLELLGQLLNHLEIQIVLQMIQKVEIFHVEFIDLNDGFVELTIMVIIEIFGLLFVLQKLVLQIEQFKPLNL